MKRSSLVSLLTGGLLVLTATPALAAPHTASCARHHHRLRDARDGSDALRLR